jgi:hypothetical protein
MAPPFPRKGAYSVTPERNLREDDPTANRIGLSQTEDRAPALGCALLQGRAITSFTDPVTGITNEHIIIPAGGTVSIPHKLGRKVVGWIVTRNGNAAGTGNTLPTEQVGTDENFLVLANPGPVDLRVDLWVY